MPPRIVQTKAAPLRAVRATLFTAVCVVLAGAGHATVSGRAVPPWVLLAACVAVGALAWAGVSRRRGPYAIGGALLVLQAGLHLLFARLAPTPPAAHPAAGHPPPAGHGHPGTHTAATVGHSGGHHGAAQDGSDALLAGAVHGSPAMTSVHLLAALGCALWLWRGEAALFTLLRLLGDRAHTVLVLLLAPAPEPSAATGPRPVAAPAAPRTVLLAHSRHGRAPPRPRRDLPAVALV
ncbi:hypothetical protein MTQ01_09350 [Streptomyces sp. XM4193]|uniref:hypothetical protein n=1 Tax=Streptomyces sp. XM4193 TaxID=2929782 RepID=UPI001FFBE28E|nr:hypothetical protein [Streptomyces sp. XM4193]MCK1796203.1 hypothetical protein [Streptomyces sp. XM4193]